MNTRNQKSEVRGRRSAWKCAFAVLLWSAALASYATAQVVPRDPLSVDRTNKRVNESVKIPSGKTLTIESGATLNVASGATLSGQIGTQSFANDAAREAATPSRVGELGVQVDDGTLYRGSATSPGLWDASFALTHKDQADATLLTLTTPYNDSASAPVMYIHSTDIGFSGKMFMIETDSSLMWITSACEVMAAAYYFNNDVNTGLTWTGGGGDAFALTTGGGYRVVISNTAVTIQSGVYLAVPKTITAGATTGAQTIDKMAGSVNFAASATSLVVTNSLVTTSSVIVATVGTNDSTMKSVQVVAGSGAFTIYANAAATAETRVNFLVIN
jgi:hypothetical protein